MYNHGIVYDNTLQRFRLFALLTRWHLTQRQVCKSWLCVDEQQQSEQGAVFGPQLPFYGLPCLLIEVSKIQPSQMLPVWFTRLVMQRSITLARVKKSLDYYDLELNIHRREKRGQMSGWDTQSGKRKHGGKEGCRRRVVCILKCCIADRWCGSEGSTLGIKRYNRMKKTGFV